MRAVTCAHGALEVVDLPAPRPAAGQVVLEVVRCGICGSDLHAKDQADELAEVMLAVGYDASIRSDRPTVLGHEICGEVVERGRGAPRELRPGTLAVTFPLVRVEGSVHLTGLSPRAPGGTPSRCWPRAR